MIYFVTAREIGRVKIGFSEEPRSRFVKMRTDSPVPLELERICEGDLKAERALHELFAAERLSGEWFTISPALDAYMESLPPVRIVERPLSLNKMLISLGMSKGYASQLLACPEQIPIPVLVAAYRAHGIRLGKLEAATDDEIDVLEQYCGCWASNRQAAA